MAWKLTVLVRCKLVGFTCLYPPLLRLYGPCPEFYMAAGDLNLGSSH